MYLAHHCITLGQQFQNSLPGQLNSPATTFVDLVPVLRKSGTDCFLEQIVSKGVEGIIFFWSWPAIFLNMALPRKKFQSSNVPAKVHFWKSAFRPIAEQPISLIWYTQDGLLQRRSEIFCKTIMCEISFYDIVIISLFHFKR